MIVKQVAVGCDFCTIECDAAMATAEEARAEARKMGWQRKAGPEGMVDMCPDCYGKLLSPSAWQKEFVRQAAGAAAAEDDA